MKKYRFLLLLACCGFFTSAQAQQVVNVAKILKKDASAVEKVSWKETTLCGGYGVYRMPYRALRQRVKPPLRGRIAAEGEYFSIKGSNKFPDVVSFAKGVVVRSNEDGIVINHGNGFESYYGNVVSPAVKTGERVKKGQFIGRLHGDKTLALGLSLNGTPVDVCCILDPDTGLDTYAGNLYIYKSQGSVFVSRYSPMIVNSRSKALINEEFVFFYKKGIKDHRAKRDFVDETLRNAREDEISLEEVQVGPAKKQDTLRVRNNIVL